VTRPDTQQLRAALEALVTDRVTPGYAAMLRTGGETVELFGGTLDDEAGSAAPDRDTVYDIASLTKVLATWGVMGRLVADGSVRLEDPVSRFFPDVHPGWAEHTLADLLLHRTQLPAATWLSQYGEEPGAIRTGVLSAEPVDRPSVPAQYLNRGYIVLGWVVENVVGEPFDQVVARVWWGPLGLGGTHFNPLDAGVPSRRIAPTEDIGGEVGRLRGVVHDENARWLGGVAGHAGAFSTLGDLSRFAGLVLGDDASLRLAPDFLRLSQTPVEEWTDDRYRALGWWVSRDGSLVRHDGFTGTTICLAPHTGDVGVLLTNAVYFGRRNPRVSAVRDLLSAITSGRGHP
jgi:CubicO group peptidase (beta-lactamase class C family)